MLDKHHQGIFRSVQELKGASELRLKGPSRQFRKHILLEPEFTAGFQPERQILPPKGVCCRSELQTVVAISWARVNAFGGKTAARGCAFRIREVLRLNGYEQRSERFRSEPIYGGETASKSGNITHA
jgi:hypothetical protein